MFFLHILAWYFSTPNIMNKSILLILLLFVSSKLTAQTFNILPYTPSENFFLNSVFFLDEAHGYVGLGNFSNTGTLLTTTDAGLTWSETSFADCSIITSIYFSDINNGFITTDNQNVSYKTTDGGVNWVSVFCQTDGPGLAYFKDNDTAFYYRVSSTGNTFAKSTDAGSSWTAFPIENAFNLSLIQDIHFPNNAGDIGFLIDTDYVYKTTDNGVTWNEIYETTDTLSDAESLFFIDTEIGFRTRQSQIEKTTDGGISWEPISTFGGQDISFIDTNIGFVQTTGTGAATEDNIFKTDDQGASWQELKFNNTSEITDFHFVNENLGYVITLDTIYKVTDTQVLSIADIAQKQTLVAFPNPATTHIRFKNKLDMASKYSLYNSFGQDIQSGTFKTEINVQHLPSGIYVLKIANSKTLKIIKN